MSTIAATDRRELAHRQNDGLDITLFWTTTTNRVSLLVIDSHSGEVLEFGVEGSAALDAFNHPYAYAASQHAHSTTQSELSAAL